VKRATEALVHEAQTRTRDVGDDVDTAAAGGPAVTVTVSGSKMVTGMAQVSCLLGLLLLLRLSSLDPVVYRSDLVR